MIGNKSNQSSSQSDQEMVDLADDPSFQAGLDNVTMKSNQSSRRGPKPVPASWSRIIDFSNPSEVTIDGFKIQEDIDNLEDEAPQVPKSVKKTWRPLFNPKSFWGEHEKHDLKSNKLGKRALKTHGKDATLKRRMFIDRAVALVQQDQSAIDAGVESIEELSKKLQNRGTGLRKNPFEIKPAEYIEPTPKACRKRGKGRPKLTAGDKIDIVHKVLHGLHPEKDVAKEYRITQQCVSLLSNKAKKNHSFL